MAAKATKKTKTRAQKPATKVRTKVKTAAKKTASKKAAPTKAKKAVAKPKIKGAVKKATPKNATAKTVTKKTVVKKTAVKKKPAVKSAAKKAAPKKAAAKKTTPKTAAKKSTTKKTTAKKTAKKKTSKAAKLTAQDKPAKKPTPRKTSIVARPERPERIDPTSIRPAPKKETKVTTVPGPRPSKLGFKLKEFVVYPAHGVGRITAVDRQEVAGYELELYVITFEKDKMTLRVPTNKSEAVGLRKLSEPKVVANAINTLKGKAKVKRTMWSRRAQEYESKINSGDLIFIAEVVRDLFRSDKQPEQSYSERQLFEAAIDRMAREVAAAESIDDAASISRLQEVLIKAAGKAEKKAEEAAAEAAEAAQ